MLVLNVKHIQLIQGISFLNHLGVKLVKLSYSTKRCLKRVNIYYGKSYKKELRTGQHIISDAFCVKCGREVGWTYVFQKASCILLNLEIQGQQNNSRKSSFKEALF